MTKKKKKILCIRQNHVFVEFHQTIVLLFKGMLQNGSVQIRRKGFFNGRWTVPHERDCRKIVLNSILKSVSVVSALKRPLKGSQLGAFLPIGHILEIWNHFNFRTLKSFSIRVKELFKPIILQKGRRPPLALFVKPIFEYTRRFYCKNRKIGKEH